MGVIIVDGANPNGNPINANMPRQDYSGYGEITDVCLKRKIRNYLMLTGHDIFVQTWDLSTDGCNGLQERQKKFLGKIKEKDETALKNIYCNKWLDVRAFGQDFAFKKSGQEAMGIRGPVTITFATSIDPVEPEIYHISNAENRSETEEKRGSDTMGMKYAVRKAAYVFHGSIHPQLADLTGFSEEDAETIKTAILHMFEFDGTASRPAGTMDLHRLYWWTHSGGRGSCSPTKLFRSIKIESSKEWPYYTATQIDTIPNVRLEEYVDGELVGKDD